MEISTGMGEYPVEKTHNPNNEEMVIDLVQLAKALWRRAWAILLAMVVFGGAAFSYAYFIITPLYKASAMLYVNNSSLSVGSTKVDLSDLNAPRAWWTPTSSSSRPEPLWKRSSRQQAFPMITRPSPKMIEAGAVNSTEVFSIEVTSPDPAEAERIANTIAELCRTVSRKSWTAARCALWTTPWCPAKNLPPASPGTRCLGCCWRGGQLRYHRAAVSLRRPDPGRGICPANLRPAFAGGYPGPDGEKFRQQLLLF